MRVTILALVLAGCGGDARPALVVGAEEGAAGRLGGELLALALSDAGVPVTRRMDLGSPRAVHEALRAGEIDVAVERTGEALRDVLHAPIEREPTRAWLAVRTGYRPMGLEWLSRLGWNDPWALVAKPDVARALGVGSLEQLGPRAMQLRVAVDADALDTRDGFAGMTARYSIGFLDKQRVAPGGVGEALARGRADMGFLHRLDAHVARDHLVVMEDGLEFFPPCEAAPVVRRAALKRHPKARAALEALAGRVSTEAMQAAIAATTSAASSAGAQARALFAKVRGSSATDRRRSGSTPR